MTKEKIKEFLHKRKGYLKEGGARLCIKLNMKVDTNNINLCKLAIKEVKNELNSLTIYNGNHISNNEFIVNTSKNIFKEAFEQKQSQIIKFKPISLKLNNSKRVLVIGDLHEPFTLEGYLEHCVNIYKKHNCNEVIFIGDIIDNHASSYHETNPDGHNAGAELKLAITNIKKWYSYFPKATVIIGNHDRLIMRKAQTAGLSKMWIKDYAEVLGTPGWNFVESIEIDDVLYIHGEGGTARQRARRDLQSIVQGHLHTQAYVDWVVGSKFKIFGCQVGCGIDHKTYAMTYAKEFAKPAIGCAVILEGKTVFNEMMEL